MKNRSILACLVIICQMSLTIAQNKLVKIEGMIFNSTANEFILSPIFPNPNEVDSSKIFRIIPDQEGNFNIEFPFIQKDYYTFQVENKSFFLIIDAPKNIKIYADGGQLNQHLNIVGSDDSKNMFDFIFQTELWKVKIDSANQAIAKSPDKRKEISDYMQSEYVKFQGLLNNFIGANQNSPALIAALNGINAEKDFKTYEKIITSLNANFGESRLVKEYYKNYKTYVQSLEDKKKLGRGKPAPLFEETLIQPINGKKTLQLNDLKGKTILLDFWASWCGPCRRENPNVVKSYNKYKEHGFTVVSVSLDTDKQKWKGAIQKDQLSWPYHVSDLAGWKSKVGQLYEVNSIPFTVLIDTEGNIITTNLRGSMLEEELHKIYGF